MIRLQKGNKPELLEKKGAKWTQDLLAKINAGEEPTEYLQTRYRHKEIKDALIEETHGKCAYCESKVLHIAYGDVEHIVPKSLRRELTFEWANLTLACDVCNTNKGDFVGDHDRLIDPYVTDPVDHFNIFGPLIWAKPGDGDGRITEIEIDLNRGPLVERRIERLKAVRELTDAIAAANDPAVEQTLRRDFEQNELASDKEYAAFAREFYRRIPQQ